MAKFLTQEEADAIVEDIGKTIDTLQYSTMFGHEYDVEKGTFTGNITHVGIMIGKVPPRECILTVCNMEEWKKVREFLVSTGKQLLIV